MSGTSRDVVQAGAVSGGIHFHDQHDTVTRPRQLPRVARIFINRSHELRQLDALTEAQDAQNGAGLCVVTGTAGAGKTALALRWAHGVQERFADGTLYVNLRGYDPGPPIAAYEALRRFLLALGAPAAAMPDDTESASALYRSLLAERRVLIVLDNAAGAAQVRPLLPGAFGCLVLITSRGHLSGLVVRDGARRLSLDTFPEDEAVALLRGLIDDYRSGDTLEQLTELARLCARLPLALRVAAERAVSSPHLSLEEMIEDLRDESALWDALSTGGGADDEAVRSVFAWSYRALPPDAARLFRLLGLHPGPEISLEAAAALAASSARRTRQQLDLLVGAHMVQQSGPGRYEFHDLLRAYAADEAQTDEPEAERRAALVRVLDWYLHSADAAQTLLEPAEEHLALDPAAQGVAPVSFTEYDQAVDWAEREQPNFPSAVRAAANAGMDRHAWLLAAVLWNAKSPSSTVGEWTPLGRVGLEAARRIGEPAGEALLLDDLGFAHTMTNQLDEAAEYHTASFSVRRATDDRSGMATSLNALGLVHRRRRRLREAAAAFLEAEEQFRACGETHWQVVSSTNLALVRFDEGDLADAAARAEHALTLHRTRNDKRSMGNALWILSGVRLDQGETDAALQAAQEAVELALDLRNQTAEAAWLLALGNAQLAAGTLQEALASYHRSAVLHRRLGERSREAQAWRGAGETYHRLGRDREAADFLKQAAATHRELGEDWQLACTLRAHAEAVVGHAPQEARRYCGEAQELTSQYTDARALSLRRYLASLMRGA
ncbi:ATP-binding protein [Streptomyces sp. NPDC050560]|uniref:ATP-binding protein n=1 Tax=Streptomyces sp. NPDC050560 TaxID=3365630 RepID=UPI0037B5C9F8